jgi:hypothetical protein
MGNCEDVGVVGDYKIILKWILAKGVNEIVSASCPVVVGVNDVESWCSGTKGVNFIASGSASCYGAGTTMPFPCASPPPHRFLCEPRYADDVK